MLAFAEGFQTYTHNIQSPKHATEILALKQVHGHNTFSQYFTFKILVLHNSIVYFFSSCVTSSEPRCRLGTTARHISRSNTLIILIVHTLFTHLQQFSKSIPVTVKYIKYTSKLQLRSVYIDTDSKMTEKNSLFCNISNETVCMKNIYVTSPTMLRDNSRNIISPRKLKKLICINLYGLNTKCRSFYNEIQI